MSNLAKLAELCCLTAVLYGTIGVVAPAESNEPHWVAVDGYTSGEGNIAPALEVARSILAAAADHPAASNEQEKIIMAAEFLVVYGSRMYDDESRLSDTMLGLQVLETHRQDYEHWATIYKSLGKLKDDLIEITNYLEDQAQKTNDPVERATARYYSGYRYARLANRVEPEERESIRQKALDMIEGLSEGVEDRQFIETIIGSHLKIENQTFLQAEQRMLDTIRHGTAGGVVNNFSGTLLDHTQESFDKYRGKVVLLNFWATWCGPCLVAIPRLQELYNELPKDQFEILNLSSDFSPAWLKSYLNDNEIRWPQWFLGGLQSPATRLWQIESLPTYVLVDRQGRILAKSQRLTKELLSEVREVVNRS